MIDPDDVSTAAWTATDAEWFGLWRQCGGCGRGDCHDGPCGEAVCLRCPTRKATGEVPG